MSKKSRSAESAFLLPFQQKMRPLNPTKRAREGANSAFERMQLEYPSLLPEPSRNSNSTGVQGNLDDPVYRQIVEIAHTYWFEHRVYERKSSDEFNTELKKIQKAAADLSDVFASAPPAVLGLLGPALQRQFSGNPIWPGLAEQSSNLSEEKKVTLVIEGLAAACKRSFIPKSPPGAREKKHLIKATDALVSIWRNSGRDFKKSLQPAPGHGGSYEFTSEGPQFVWRILSAIDPELRIGEVKSALQKIGGKKQHLSRNSLAIDGNC